MALPVARPEGARAVLLADTGPGSIGVSCRAAPLAPGLRDAVPSNRGTGSGSARSCGRRPDMHLRMILADERIWIRTAEQTRSGAGHAVQAQGGVDGRHRPPSLPKCAARPSDRCLSQRQCLRDLATQDPSGVNASRLRRGSADRPQQSLRAPRLQPGRTARAAVADHVLAGNGVGQRAGHLVLGDNRHVEVTVAISLAADIGSKQYWATWRARFHNPLDCGLNLLLRDNPG